MSKRFSIIVLLVAFYLTGSVLASNVEYGTPVKAQIVSAKAEPGKVKGRWVLKAELLESCRGPGIKGTSKGAVVEIKATVQLGTSFSQGQKLQVRWMKYGAMGSNGPVSGTSWEIAP